MPPDPALNSIFTLDVSNLSFPYRFCAAALQGLLNRDGPRLFLDYGIYDDPAARRTNEVFMDDALWFGKYRDLLGNQDQRNLEYYCHAHGFQPQPSAGLEELVHKHRGQLNGCVVGDEGRANTRTYGLVLLARRFLVA